MLYDREATVAGKEYEQVIESVEKNPRYCKDCKHRKDKWCDKCNAFVPKKKGACGEYERN